MTDHSAETIVRCIRATNSDGDYELRDEQATLLINWFVSAKLVDAQQIPNVLSFRKGSQGQINSSVSYPKTGGTESW